MKIAYLLPSLQKTGPILFTHNLIEGLKLQSKGYEIDVFYFEEVAKPLDFSVNCFKIGFLGKKDFAEYDIVHSTAAKPDIYVSLHKYQIKAKLVTSMHCFLYDDVVLLRGKFIGGIKCQIWRAFLSRLDNFIVSSTAMKHYYEDYLFISKKKKFEIIPYGIPNKDLIPIDEDAENILSEASKRYTLLYGCGNLIMRKGFYQLVAYLPKNKNVAVVLIGDGPYRNELIKQAETLGVRDRLIMLGYRVNSYNYYKYCDVYCLCSISEGFGLGMLEALAQGRPLVCSKLDIYKDYMKEHEVSFFEYGNQSSFDDAVDRVLANKEYYAGMAQAVFNKNFTLANMAEKHTKYYKKMLNI